MRLLILALALVGCGVQEPTEDPEIFLPPPHEEGQEPQPEKREKEEPKVEPEPIVEEEPEPIVEEEKEEESPFELVREGVPCDRVTPVATLTPEDELPEIKSENYPIEVVWPEYWQMQRTTKTGVRIVSSGKAKTEDECLSLAEPLNEYLNERIQWYCRYIPSKGSCTRLSLERKMAPLPGDDYGPKCVKGKRCGMSCIAKWKQCHK